MRVLVMVAAALVAFSAQPVRAQECPTDVGAALAAACPCSADGQGQSWKNHGQYVKCVGQLADDLYEADLITKSQRQEMKTGAAKSDVGKKN